MNTNSELVTSPFAFSEAGFAFLSELRDNNNREWFNTNKARFKRELEGPFIALLEAVTTRILDARRPLSGGKSTVFRMNRDVRFSEDKSPYKTNLSGLLTPSGTKSEVAGLLYIHLEHNGGFACAGFFNLSPKQLGPIRDAMIERAEKFDAVVESVRASGRDFADYGTLTSMPKGFAEHVDHRHAEHIKRKSLLIKEDLPLHAWIKGDVPEIAAKLAIDAMPLLTFAEPAR